MPQDVEILSVLVVEDDPLLRDLIRRQLLKLGFTAVLVGSGEEAVAHDHSKFGLIFIDMGLPWIDGAYATMLIREKGMRDQTRRIPIIALTGHADPVKALSVGMDDFLRKPALMSDIKRMLEKHFPPAEVEEKH